MAFKSETEFATVGPKHFKVWTVDGQLKGKKGGFGKRDQRIGSCVSNNGEYLAGSITGEMYVFAGGSIKKAIKLHERPIDAIHVAQTAVFTGGRDGIVNVLNQSTYAVIFKFSIDDKYKSIYNPVRALCLN